MKRLTDRQVAVLACVERLGGGTLPAIHTELRDGRAPSETRRVLGSLVARGLIVQTGNPTWTYLGELSAEEQRQWVASGRRLPGRGEIVRFASAHICVPPGSLPAQPRETI